MYEVAQLRAEQAAMLRVSAQLAAAALTQEHQHAAQEHAAQESGAAAAMQQRDAGHGSQVGARQRDEASTRLQSESSGGDVCSLSSHLPY